jgi:DNA-binding LytR/AlgR family response regulator
LAIARSVVHPFCGAQPENSHVTVDYSDTLLELLEPGTPVVFVTAYDQLAIQAFDVLPVDTVDYVQAQDDYVAFRSGGRSLLKEQTLGDVEAQLDGRRVVRIHRSYLLNIDRLARVELYAKDSRIAILRDGTTLPVSRTGDQRLQQLL